MRKCEAIKPPRTEWRDPRVRFAEAGRALRAASASRGRLQLGQAIIESRHFAAWIARAILPSSQPTRRFFRAFFWRAAEPYGSRSVRYEADERQPAGGLP
jgi:hypothetical protein